jgi:hypothetical protein
VTNANMRLWLLRPNGDEQPAWDPWYDKTFGFVIRAESELQARALADEADGSENSPSNRPWLDASQATCVEITGDGSAEIILKDMHWA